MSKEQMQLQLSAPATPFDPNAPFVLPPLPPMSRLDHPSYTPLLIKARAALAHLEGVSSRTQNPLLLISPAITRESVASSGIENIHTTLADVLQADLMSESERSGVDKEVLRYRDAILWGWRELRNLPVASRLILGVFKRLMPEHGGQYRRFQNKIENARTKTPIYTPPSAEMVPGLISNWEHFVNSTDESVDPLIRCIVGHYQFEAIHPFNDGNGRTGRILMVLQLLQQKLLTHPILFISARLLKERSDYYRVLRGVSADGAWDQFILFMLNAFYGQAEATRAIIDKMDLLHRQTKNRIKNDFPKLYTADLVDHLFRFPVTSPTHMAEKMDLTYQTASKYLKALSGGGVLQSKKRGTYRFYFNHKLLTISKAD